jgi:hypothetical protein
VQEGLGEFFTIFLQCLFEKKATLRTLEFDSCTIAAIATIAALQLTALPPQEYETVL